MKQTIPKKLKVFGKEIKVTDDEDLIREGALGMLEIDKSLIRLDRTLEGDAKWQTLLHELFHVVFSRVGLTQTRVDLDLEEIIVESLSTAVVENFNLTIKNKCVTKKQPKKTRKK